MADLRLVVEEDDDGAARLTLTGTDERAQAVFERQRWDGNGYDRGEVAQALALMKMPGRAGLLDFDPEGDFFWVMGPSRALLDELAGWLRAVIEDPKLLEDAMRFAEDHGLNGCGQL
jgi:hypothetical protein